MDQFFSKKKWYKNKKLLSVVVVVAGIAIWAIFFRGTKAPTYETIITKRADLTQEVSITGKIRPAQEVDLQFESSGRISAINYKVGDRVNTGATIASLENQELQAAVISARADYEKTVRNFNSLNDPAVSSSLRVELENAKSNLEQVTKKADGDLASKYNSAFSALREAMTQIDGSSAVLEYIRKTYLEGRSSWDDPIKQFQSRTTARVQTVRSAFPAIDQAGAMITPASYESLDLALRYMLDACQSIGSAFTFLQNEIEYNPSLISSSTDRSSVNTETAAISSDLSAVYAAIQNITDQRILNDKNIADAAAKLATAEASFPTAEDILQKEAALSSAQSQLRKTLIVAPFTGVIGKIDIERGQTVSSSVVAVSLISVAKYQIEANITEIDIGKVSVANTAMLTLDAYGSNISFNAKVSVIDTSATVVEGVTTYKTIFEFDDGPLDPGIRPNMTANIDIQTAVKTNIIAVPQRAVISKNGNKLVRIYHGDKIPLEERMVKTGMSGKDGYVEITEGLSEGEKVVTFINE